MATERVMTLATRASPLALWQARRVAAALRRAWPRLRIALLPLSSSGDRDRETPLYGSGTAGVFSKLIQEAVLDGRADAAVHSCKDLPTEIEAGMSAPIVLRRGDPRDCLVGARSAAELPRDARVGSSSLRRRVQLAALRPDLRFVDLRGNVATRLGKVAAGELDATVLATAGLRRLGLRRHGEASPLSIEEMVPAPAQGCIAVDHAVGDSASAALLAPLRCHESATAAGIERAVLHGLRGGCSLPFGCLARRRHARWHAIAALSGEDGALHRVAMSGPAQTLASRILERLLASDSSLAS